MDGAYAWLSKLEFVCDNSPYINLDAMVLRQRLQDAGVNTVALDAGSPILSWPSTGVSYMTWQGARTICSPTCSSSVGSIKTLDTLPAVAAMHATLDSPQSIQWVPTGGTGATFCIVARLAAAAAVSNQVLLDFSPVFKMARDGTDSSLVFSVGAAKLSVGNAFDGKWHSYTAVTTGTGTVLYVDGVKKGTLTHGAVAGTASTTHYFGAPSQTPAALLAGDVRQLMAWRRPLAGVELNALNTQMKSKWKL